METFWPQKTMKPIYQSFLLLALFYQTVYGTASNLSPILRSKLNAFQLALIEGYDISKHEVITQDYATLSLYRIPGKKDRDKMKKPKGVILLLPGVSNSASVFLMRGKESIAFYLSEGNYEVWVADLRGQSEEATIPFTYVLGPKGWYFSLDEQSLYDMPAMIDHVREISGFDKIHIVGFSMGTSITFQVLSALPEYNDKVASFTALAPAVYVTKDSSPFKTVNQLPDPLGSIVINFLALTGVVFGAFPLFAIFTQLVGRASLYSPLLEKISLAITQAFVGKDPDLAKVPFDLLLAHNTPLPTFALLQSYQNTQSGKFQKFDFGPLNKKVYGQATPPVYDLTKIKVPVFYATGQKDNFQSPENNKFVTDQLKKGGSLYHQYTIKSAYVDHFGFLANKNAFEYINEPVLQFIEAISNGTTAADFKMTVPSN